MTRGEAFRAMVGDLARPFSIYISSLSASFATGALAVGAAIREVDLSDAALFIGAVWAGVGALYWGKAFENVGVAKAGPPPSPQRRGDRTPDLPPWERGR